MPSDLAVIDVAAENLPALALGDSNSPRVGDVVLAVGNPLGVGQTVTMGILSAKGRTTEVGDGSYQDFLQTDAPINRGNSGGALVDRQRRADRHHVADPLPERRQHRHRLRDPGDDGEARDDRARLDRPRAPLDDWRHRAARDGRHRVEPAPPRRPRRARQRRGARQPRGESRHPDRRRDHQVQRHGHRQRQRPAQHGVVDRARNRRRADRRPRPEVGAGQGDARRAKAGRVRVE